MKQSMRNNALPADIERVLASEDAIEQAIQRMAAQISQDYAGREVLLIGILKGAFIFLADLSRHLTIPHTVDFMSLSSYGATATTSGEVRIIMDLRTFIRSKDVIIVEDIVDTGYTLIYLQQLLGARQPASLKTCVLLSKPDRRKVPVTIDYLGFEIPDHWVVGYGLDYADKYRTLPYIGILKPNAYCTD
jgi:hypoxanthine phosphoribosyltransferase